MPAPHNLCLPAYRACYPSIMLETLLPLFYLHFTPLPQEEMMVPAHRHEPMMMHEERTYRTPTPQRDSMPMWRESHREIRRKGYQPTDENYFAKLLEHAVRSQDPDFPTMDWSQRTHREYVQTNRRSDRKMKEYPSGCEFPCTE